MNIINHLLHQLSEPSNPCPNKQPHFQFHFLQSDSLLVLEQITWEIQEQVHVVHVKIQHKRSQHSQAILHWPAIVGLKPYRNSGSSHAHCIGAGGERGGGRRRLEIVDVNVDTERQRRRPEVHQASLVKRRAACISELLPEISVG